MTKLMPPALQTMIPGTACDSDRIQYPAVAPFRLKSRLGELPIEIGIGWIRLVLVFFEVACICEVPVLV